MNTPARYALATAALTTLLLTSGCFTTKTARAEPSPRNSYQLAVVDKSKDLEVTPQLLADLRASVTDYLKESGYTRDGQYVVKVNLTPDLPGDAGKWVVLRIDNMPARTYTLLAAYPGADDYYPYDFGDYYDYGYPTFARYGYYDPFDHYYGAYVAPAPVPPRHNRPGDKDNPPPATHNRGDGHTPPTDRHPDNSHLRPDNYHPRPDNYHPRPDNPRSNGRDHWRDSNPRPESTSRDNGGGSYTSSPAPSYSPPPASSSPSSPPAQSREERTPGSNNER